MRLKWEMENPQESKFLASSIILLNLILHIIFRFFTQPQVKSALKMFGDQLDWINKMLEDYMKENKVATESKAPLAGKVPKSSLADPNKKKSRTSNLSLKSMGYK